MRGTIETRAALVNHAPLVRGGSHRAPQRVGSTVLDPWRPVGYARPAFRVARLAVLWNPATGSDLELRATRAAASKLGVTLKLIAVRNADDRARVFAALEKDRPDALTMFFDSLTTGYRGLVGDFAKKHKLPTVFGAREFVEAGGLMAYSPNIAEGFRRAATYVDKILKGAKPGDLPVEQPTKFELIVNVKTAEAIGLTIPQSILARADAIIR